MMVASQVFEKPFLVKLSYLRPIVDKTIDLSYAVG